MNRVRIGVCFVGLVAGLVAIGAACGGTQETIKAAPTASVTPAPAPTPKATGSAGPADKPADLRNPAEVEAASWLDDDAIKALAQDCNWDPGGCLKSIEAAALQSMETIDFLPEDGKPQEGDTRVLPAAACRSLVPLACAHVPSQTCVPDECSQWDYDCVPACDKTCSGCASKCVSGCETCKSGCKDEACKLACAKSCGECRQSCLKALDTCASAKCSEEAENCYKTRDDEWTKSTCPKVCPKVQSCVEKCPEIENDFTGQLYYSDCAKKCLSKLGKGCPSRFDRICAGDPNASVNFNAYHSQRHPGE